METVAFFESISDEKADYRYAAGKWTIKEVLMHIIDTERVFSYRGLAAARAMPRPTTGWMKNCMLETLMFLVDHCIV
jgi:uncharacterized damage-inducible protein DinB